MHQVTHPSISSPVYSGLQWLSVVMLTGGVAMVQLSQNKSSSSNKEQSDQDSIWGLVSVLLGCLTSGFAGVYFEMVLKSSKASIWLRNIQLSVIGIFIRYIAYRRMHCLILRHWHPLLLMYCFNYPLSYLSQVHTPSSPPYPS